MNLFTGGSEDLEPSLDVLERVVEDAFARADRDRSGLISYEEFVLWARSNRDLMAGLETLNKLATDAKLECVSEDSATDVEEGEMSDAEVATERSIPRPRMDNNRGGGDEAVPPSNSSGSGSGNRGGNTGSTADEEFVPWKAHIYEPTNHVRDRKKLNQGPGANLELGWAFGFRAQTVRNNLRYLITDADADVNSVVYPTASLGIVYHMKSREQRFYQGHSTEITCLAVHPSGLIVATGDASSNIHLWSTQTMTCLNIIKGLVKDGMQHLAFSPYGDRIAGKFKSKFKSKSKYGLRIYFFIFYLLIYFSILLISCAMRSGALDRQLWCPSIIIYNKHIKHFKHRI